MKILNICAALLILLVFLFPVVTRVFYLGSNPYPRRWNDSGHVYILDALEKYKSLSSNDSSYLVTTIRFDYMLLECGVIAALYLIALQFVKRKE